jgi:Subtilase family
VASSRNRKHIIVSKAPNAVPYRTHPKKIKSKKSAAPPDRALHALALRNALLTASDEAKRRRAAEDIQIPKASPGLYIQFESQPNVPLLLSSLEDKSQGIELVAVSEHLTQEEVPRRIQRATVFVPDDKVRHFLERFAAYAQKAPRQKKGERRHEAMLDPVASLQLATLQSLWTDVLEDFPTPGEVTWWEVWLRRQKQGGELERLMEFAGAKQLAVSPQRLQFDDRIVTLVRATPEQLSASIDVLADIAELRRAKEAAAFFIDDLSPREQGAWIEDLLARVKAPSPDAPSVCVIDTGVTREHNLLAGALDQADCHACEPDWGTDDHHGHGTQMSGLALYGDLAPLLSGKMPVQLRHRLESVKILPPQGENQPEMYGTRTAEATSRVEIQAPHRRRCFSMAITCPDARDRGQPTSWSAAVDALAAGRAFDSSTQGLVYLDEGGDPLRRLFLVSAGNVEPGRLQAAHLDRSDTDVVEDPAQAWNALTIGAFTEKTLVSGAEWVGWQPVAPAGELSPWSLTGVAFADAWPIKPEVVFEGGNVVKNAKGEISFPCLDLCQLTTYFRPQERSLEHTSGTSSATAQIARMAATLSAEYPALWPEAVRALIVHSAEWTAPMLHWMQSTKLKSKRARLVARYGYGVPRIERALRSASDSLTLITQGTIRPFANGKMNEMHFHKLPWPKEGLLALGSTKVRLRVTLSYFIEPNPGRRGWLKRYRYASHGLRFTMKSATELEEEFRKRVNMSEMDPDEEKPDGVDSSEWHLGQARNRGSIHSDFFDDSATDLAERGMIAIYPVSGWWKDQNKRDRSKWGVKYALVVSIEAPGVETDLWTPVAQEVQAPIVVEG